MNKELTALNEVFAQLSPSERIAELFEYFEDKDVLFTSSFGTTSAYLLHLMSTIRPEKEVHFLDTTYHFEETIAYRDSLVKQLGLKIVEILPDPTQNGLTKREQTWVEDPDLCCMVNKIVPMDAVKVDYKVWITGLMGYQTHFRSGMNLFDYSQGIIKFNPLIDVLPTMVKEYFKEHQLPQHPLKAKGYHSVGCTHCTLKGKGRQGRWANSAKTECGLHSEEMKKNRTVQC